MIHNPASGDCTGIKDKELINLTIHRCIEAIMRKSSYEVDERIKITRIPERAFITDSQAIDLKILLLGLKED